MKINRETKIEYEKILTYRGADNLFNFILSSAVCLQQEGKLADVIFLNESEGFFSLFRQTGNQNYFEIGKILRRAAHKLYRNRLKTTKVIDNRFLNRIK